MTFIKDLYLDNRLFIALGSIALLYVIGYFISTVYILANVSALALAMLVGIDLLALFNKKMAIAGRRFVADKLSNGDENNIEIYLENFYPFTVKSEIIDELPVEFQKRDFSFEMRNQPGQAKILHYNLRPDKRGAYQFGSLHAYVASPLHLVRRRFSFSMNQPVKVYPSYQQMRKYELLAISNKLTMAGIKKIRRIGHSIEFEHIRDYVVGDDYRSINWKATAKKNKLMVNQYQDERSQQVYCLIDMGRVMKMPFEGLSLLDYAINASLVISNVAINKEDKAGVITFSNKVHEILPAEKRNNQMHHILEMLYRQQTDFMESSMEGLYSITQRKLKQRSLLLLFTNFESLSAVHRQLDYLKQLAAKHLLVVVFFENTELRSLTGQIPATTEDIYIKTIAEKFMFEKKLIVKELERYGIFSIFTPPQNLTVSTINKYLELKSTGLI